MPIVGQSDFDDTDYEDRVCALCDLEEGLTSWEVDFLDSMVDWIGDGRVLTEKQKQTINRIYERVFQ